MSNLDHGEHYEMEIALGDDELILSEATCGSFFSYVAGVTYQIRKKYPNVGGMLLNNYKTTLPVKKGLSSSAAVCVLTARALNQLYGLNLTKREEMEFAYLGETTTPSKCGRMDQGCAFGCHPVLMTFDGDNLDVKEDVKIGGPIHLIIVDLCAAKNTPAILRDLRKCYPNADTDLEKGVQSLLGEINHSIMKGALEALEKGCAKTVGEYMIQAQKEFDTYATPASPENLTSPMLHKLLTYEPLQQHVYGGKGVGSQGDGSAQFVAKSKEDQEKCIKIIESEMGMYCLPLTLGEQEQS